MNQTIDELKQRLQRLRQLQRDCDLAGCHRAALELEFEIRMIQFELDITYANLNIDSDRVSDS